MFYVGVRIEINSRSLKNEKLQEIFNTNSNNTKILELYRNGKITVNKKDNMLIACGKKDDKSISNLTNFSVLVALEKPREDIERVVKIVNVLGNDKLIKEKVKTFVLEQSILNKISEFSQLKQSFIILNELIPHFIETAWYYAPEAKIE